MLYDPKWEKQRPTISGFASWLSLQPPNAEYDWLDCKGGCAVDQYFASIGASRNWLPAEREPLERLALEHPRTFGSLFERARAAQLR